MTSVLDNCVTEYPYSIQFREKGATLLSSSNSLLVVQSQTIIQYFVELITNRYENYLKTKR